jgi:hypothetical protein
VGGNCGTVPVWQGTVTRRVRHWEGATLTSDVTDTFTTTIAIRAPIAGCPYPNYVAGTWSEPLQHVNGVATDPCTTTTIAVTAECTGGSDELVTTSTNSFGTTTDTVTYDLSVSENTCCDLCDRNLFRKCEYVWDCVNASGTVRPLWQRCMTGAVTHDWPDEADVQCTIRNGRKVKIFTKIEDLGDCPDPLPDINTSLPSPPTVTDCTDCPAGPKCLWRFFAKYTIGGIWAAYGSPVFIGCRRTKDFPTWRFFNGSTPDCIFAIDVFAEECDEASDCSLTPPTAPACQWTGRRRRALGRRCAMRC